MNSNLPVTYNHWAITWLCKFYFLLLWLSWFWFNIKSWRANLTYWYEGEVKLALFKTKDNVLLSHSSCSSTINYFYFVLFFFFYFSSKKWTPHGPYIDLHRPYIDLPTSSFTPPHFCCFPFTAFFMYYNVYKRSRVFFDWQFSWLTRTLIPSGAS